MSLEYMQSFIKIGGVVFEKMFYQKQTENRIYYQDCNFRKLGVVLCENMQNQAKIAVNGFLLATRNQVHVVMTVDTADKMYFLFNLKRSYVLYNKM